MVIMLTRSSVQRPVLDRCSTVRRPEVAIAAEQPDDCSFRRNAVTATTGSPSPSISRTGSQRSRAATTAPLLAATSVDKARSSPSPLIMTQTVAPPDVRQHDWAPRQFNQQENVGRADSFSLCTLGGVASTSTTNARSALLAWSGACSPASCHARARAAAGDHRQRYRGTLGQRIARARHRRIGGDPPAHPRRDPRRRDVGRAVPAQASDTAIRIDPDVWKRSGLF